MCAGADYEADDVMVTIGSGGMIGSKSAVMEGGFNSACIFIDTLTDDAVEGDETFSVVGEVVSNANIARFPDGNTVSGIIHDATGEGDIGGRLYCCLAVSCSNSLKLPPFIYIQLVEYILSMFVSLPHLLLFLSPFFS